MFWGIYIFKFRHFSARFPIGRKLFSQGWREGGGCIKSDIQPVAAKFLDLTRKVRIEDARRDIVFIAVAFIKGSILTF